MSKNNKNKLVPRLRFPEFQNAGEWEVKRLGDILDVESSALALNKLELKRTGYEVYGADSIVGYIDDFQHKEPYISIVKDGSGVGRLNLCKAQTSILGTLSALKTKDVRKYNLVWVYYLLNTVNFSIYVKGAGIPHIYYSDYKHHQIAVASPGEQQKIATCLSSLDEVIAGEREKLELLQQHKKGLLQQLFPQEGETVPRLRFPEFQNAGEWEVKKLGDILDVESSALALNKLELKRTGYEVYGADSIVGYIDDFQHKEPYISIVKDGSGVGRLNLCKAQTSILGTLSALKTKDVRKYNLVWAYYLLNTVNFSIYVKGAGIPHIYYSDYKHHQIAVASPAEQQKIASCLSSLDDLIAAQSQKIELLEQHKKGLLQGLFPMENG